MAQISAALWHINCGISSMQVQILDRQIRHWEYEKFGKECIFHPRYILKELKKKQGVIQEVIHD